MRARHLAPILLLAAAAAAQTIDVGSMKPPEAGKPNNTVGLGVVLEQAGGGDAVTIRAKGTAKLPDGCTVEGFLKHKVNDSPLSSATGTVAGGVFDISFGPFNGVYPGLYEVEVVFYPERAPEEVQTVLKGDAASDAWKSPSIATATIMMGGEKDPKRQAAEAEAKSYEAMSKVAARLEEIDRALAKGHQEGGLSDTAFAERAMADLSKVAEEAQKESGFFGNPFVTEMNHRFLACKAISDWLEPEIAFLRDGKLPRGVEGNTEDEKRESASAVFLSLREATYGALAAAKGSGRLVDLSAADVLADVGAAREAREALAKALALEKKGPPNSTRYKDAVGAYRDSMAVVSARNMSAVGTYGVRAGLAKDEERFKKAREDLAKALEGAKGSSDRYQKVAGKYELSAEAKSAEAEIDKALAAIESHLK